MRTPKTYYEVTPTRDLRKNLLDSKESSKPARSSEQPTSKELQSTCIIYPIFVYIYPHHRRNHLNDFYSFLHKGVHWSWACF